jgi:hypothetical protein
VTQLTGLLTSDGQRKAWGEQFQRLAGQLTSQPPRPATLGPRPGLPWDQCVTDPVAGDAFREAYFRAFSEDVVEVPENGQ